MRFTVVAASFVPGPYPSTVATVNVIRCRGLREGTDRRYSSNVSACGAANSCQVRPSRSKKHHRC